MQLYYFETPNGHQACAVARHVGADIEMIRVDLAKGEQRSPDFLAINPNGKIPALVDGDRKLWEAPAIMWHLATKAGSDLLPATEADRIDALQWIHWNTAHFSRHAGKLFWERVIKRHFLKQAPDPAEVEEATGFFKQFAGVLNGHLQGRDFVVGDRLSIVDFAIGAFLAQAEPAQLPLEGCDEIGRWYAQLEALPAWREPYPAQQTEPTAA